MFPIDDDGNNHISKELKLFKKSTLRRKISVFYAFGHNEISSFQRAVNSGNTYPEVTGLEIKLRSSDFPDYEGLAQFFWSKNFDALDVSSAFEESKPKDELSYHQSDLNEIPERSENSSVYSQSSIDPHYQEKDEEGTGVNHQAIEHQIIEEIRPFYHFELFPNLKILHIIQEDSLYPLGSFVIDGFAALQKLEDFEIFIGKRSKETIFLFAGFLKFPLFLKRFSLQINFIRGEEWIFLQQFLESHNQLQSLHVSLREKPSDMSHYKNRNFYLQNLIESLKNHSSLRALTLDPSFCSVSSFSRGLSHLITMKNQIHTFKFQAIDDTVTSQKTRQERIKGLCEFIKNQKESLHILEIAIPFALEEKIINKIAIAISKLVQLKILDLQIQNIDSKKTEEIKKYFCEEIRKDDFLIKSNEDSAAVENQKWNPILAKYLLRLENLEDFRFRIGLPDLYEKEDHKWFLDLMKELPKLERLRNVFIIVDDGAKLKKIEKELCTAVLELKNIREIYMIFWKGHYFEVTNSVLPELRRTLEKVNERQRRYDLFLWKNPPFKSLTV